MHRPIVILRNIFILLLAAAPLGGCQVGQLYGALMQNYEYQKRLEILPKYDDFDGKTVAVVVDADMVTLYEHPMLIDKVCGGVSLRMARDVPGLQDETGRSRIVDPRLIRAWQYRTPQWNAMAYGEIAEALNVDRVVYVDIYEYRLNPPGNQWMWEGVCAATVGVIERNHIDPDVFAETLTVEGRFPSTLEQLTRDEASAAALEQGTLTEFIKRTTWLFHTHLEPKYPDKYDPALASDA
jgi:hypothetical protein